MKAFRGCGFAILVAFAIALVFSSTGVRVVNGGQAAKPSNVPAGDAEKGKQIFVKDGCYECHGREGQGSSVGPRIAPSPVPFQVLVSYVRKPTDEMPPYTAKVVSDEELADIFAYLQSRPHPASAKTIPMLQQ
jgi:mono/diheme cytochrome c family protein